MAIAFLMIVVAALLYDSKQIRLGLLGSYVWVMAFTTAFFAFLAYFAQFILPLRGETGWFDGIRLLITHFVNTPLKRFSRKPHYGSANQEQVPISFAKVGAGIIESHQALVLGKGPAFTRAAGPGYVLLNRGERISALVNLRTHLCRQTVKAMTRDGIPVETAVIVIFRIRQLARDQADPGDPYPYDQDAVFRIGFAGSIGAGESSQHWTDRICPQAATELVTAVSQHTLDELFPPNSPDSDPVLSVVKQELHQKVAAHFEPYGIEILLTLVGRFDLPADVVADRIQTWQAEWRRRIQVQEAEAKAQMLKRMKMARAEAQITFIGKVTERIQALQQSGKTDLPEVVILRMLEALEEASGDELAANLGPRQITHINQMRNWLEQLRLKKLEGQ
jgi:regulator of protease activity HflC (stomatin/prohibitin superfamily)